MDGIVDSLKVCLARPEGCGVVPGLSTDQFLATFWVSLAGGVVLGFSSKLDAGQQSLPSIPTSSVVQMLSINDWAGFWFSRHCG